VKEKHTLRLPVDPNAMHSAASLASLSQGATLLRDGGTVAFPTETVYGLGANALDRSAVEKIFVAKQRPSWDPLIVHVVDEEQLRVVSSHIPRNGQLLMDAFWPGPLTLLLPRDGRIPSIVTAGRERVGVRMPFHPVARKLIEMAGIPIAAPSANSFGRTSPTRAEFVLQDLDGRIDAVIDSGETALGLESTVVDVCEENPILYRPGMVTLQQLQSVCPSVVTYQEPRERAALEALPSPGVGLKHYSPRARLVLAEGSASAQHSLLMQARALRADGETVGIMWPGGEDSAPAVQPDEGIHIFPWGQLTDQETLARRLFAGLRELDDAGVTIILCLLPADCGLGVAIRDRLKKAAM
jgi:L-threonylcarbamoyladenylate synthase